MKMSPRQSFASMLVVLALVTNCTEREVPASNTATASEPAMTTKGEPSDTVETTTEVPKPFDSGWIVMAAPQGGQAQFFSRILLSNGQMTVRDDVGKGFSTTPFVKTQDGFRGEEHSDSDGSRKWSGLSSTGYYLLGSLEWTRDGKTKTYILDGYPVRRSVFDGEWDLKLSRTDTNGEVAGHASLSYAGLDLAIGTEKWDRAVFWVRPPTHSQPVDFMTTPPGPGHVSWNGVLEENGHIVSWEEVETVKHPSLGGTITIRSDDGSTAAYRVKGSRS